MKCLCIVCGDEMVEISPGIRACDCPMRGYMPLRPRLQPELRPPIDQFGIRHVVCLFIILVMFFAAMFEACMPVP